MVLRNNLDLLAVTVISLLALTGIALGMAEWAPLLQAVLGLALVLVCPGYALVAAVFSPQLPALPQRLLLVLGASLAITVLGGLVLNLLPWGLQAGTWGGLLAVVVTLASAWVALVRRRPLGAWSEAESSFHIRPSQALMFGLAALVAATALGLTRLPSFQASPRGLQDYTLLWLLPAEPEVVWVGVNSQEFEPDSRFRLEVWMGGTLVESFETLELETGETWEERLELPGIDAATTPVEAFLFRMEEPETVYRSAKIWLNP